MSRHRGTAAPAAAATPAEAGAKGARGRSIRASLITLAVVPATALVLLWVSGSYALFDQWNNSNDVGQAAKTTYAPQPAVGEFQKEWQPRLRDRVGDADGEYGAARAAERRPEQARSMLAALRDGTRRARAQEEVPMPAWPSAARGDARRRDVPWSAAPQEKAPWSGSPRDEAPVADRNTAPSDRRQLPTRPRPTRNTP
ncbi:hypothetical protein ACFWOB_24210 [Streptomyces sp. NPDC058420]|uniref:hypothetical protein n=1 Tax=Streptomyces sp. NPDC058420 TaxID=3346489 RepID=UPI00364DF3BD